jgi:hypothetical protein
MIQDGLELTTAALKAAQVAINQFARTLYDTDDIREEEIRDRVTVIGKDLDSAIGYLESRDTRKLAGDIDNGRES